MESLKETHACSNPAPNAVISTGISALQLIGLANSSLDWEIDPLSDDAGNALLTQFRSHLLAKERVDSDLEGDRDRTSSSSRKPLSQLPSKFLRRALLGSGAVRGLESLTNLERQSKIGDGGHASTPVSPVGEQKFLDAHDSSSLIDSVAISFGSHVPIPDVRGPDKTDFATSNVVKQEASVQLNAPPPSIILGEAKWPSSSESQRGRVTTELSPSGHGLSPVAVTTGVSGDDLSYKDIGKSGPLGEANQFSQFATAISETDAPPPSLVLGAVDEDSPPLSTEYRSGSVTPTPPLTSSLTPEMLEAATEYLRRAADFTSEYLINLDLGNSWSNFSADTAIIMGLSRQWNLGDEETTATSTVNIQCYRKSKLVLLRPATYTMSSTTYGEFVLGAELCLDLAERVGNGM
ncbi:hypothetical protein HDU93_004775, partial [Gonapodya sp. JEL0774]